MYQLIYTCYLLIDWIINFKYISQKSVMFQNRIQKSLVNKQNHINTQFITLNIKINNQIILTKPKFLMDSTQIIKRRLAQLKRMSIELKQSTQNSNEVDYNIVYSILEATKSSASKLSDFKEVESRTSRSSSPLTKLLTMGSTPPYKSLFPENANESRHKHANSHKISTKASSRFNKQLSDRYNDPQTYPQAFYSPNQQPYDQSGLQFIGTIRHQSHNQFIPNNTQQQVLVLKQQNAKLQKNLSTLRQQLHQLKENLNSVQKQSQWKAGLPYFKLNQKISAFYTRMRIHQNDYHKIDYVTYDAQLTLNKLLISKPNNNMKEMGKSNTNVKELDLSELREVHYVDSIVIFLHFGMMGEEKQRNSKEDSKNDKTSSDDFFENLFIKFNNEEELHEWDLALFINFKIIDSLKKDKLFQTHQRRSRSRSPKRSSQSKRFDSHKKSKRQSDHIIEDEELIKKLIESRELYQQTKKLVSERMMEKANEKKLINSSGGNKARREDHDELEQSETHPFEIVDDNEILESRRKFNYVPRDGNKYVPSDQKKILAKDGNDFGEIQGEKSERANTSKFKDVFASGKTISPNGQNQHIPPLTIPGSSSPQKDRAVSPNPNLQQLSLSRKLQQERAKEANELRRQQQLKIKKTQQIIKKFTQQGYDLTKYSKDGFNPHDKRFFLSADLKQLCWQEEGAKNKKSIKLDSIKEVMLEKIGEGIRKHIKKPKRQEHCIISYIKEGKMKVIQLGANSTVMAQFVDQLITLIDHLKETGQ